VSTNSTTVPYEQRNPRGDKLPEGKVNVITDDVDGADEGLLGGVPSDRVPIPDDGCDEPSDREPKQRLSLVGLLVG
tara:strand:- start:45824 stop:46051 length:228 start_codon:yes stop_codon:yes gene_type:complete